MIDNGMVMARINASFADFDELQRVSRQIREISPKIAIMLDTMGHKIRVTGIDNDMEVKKGSEIIIVPQSVKRAKNNVIQITYSNLYRYVRPNNKILIDDGNITLQTTKIENKEVYCTVLNSGIIKKGKTVNIPGIHLDFPSLTEKDINDINFAIENNFDYISASFIRNSKDVLSIKELVGNNDIKIISKIENEEGVNDFDNILSLSDGIMIARGDLGVEISLEKVPVYQKRFIQKARELGKLVIVATQMLESMRENPRPTRAEVSDVANAVTDGSDALMLSAETSTGKYPVEAVKIMNKTALEVEENILCSKVTGKTKASDETDLLCSTIDQYVKALNLKGIIVTSKTGRTIASLSRHRITVPIWNICSNPKILRQCNVYRGIEGIFLSEYPIDRDQLVSKAVETVYSHGNLEMEDKIAIITGSSVTNKQTNSILEISSVKDILNI